MQITTDREFIEILSNCRTIAVVGLSVSPYRPSYGVAAYLIRAGYNIIPVNPNYEEVLGRKCYASLRDIPMAVDIVDVFRNPVHLLPVVEDTIAIGAKVLWLQLGVINEAAIERALQAGLQVVEDRCLKIEHMRYQSVLPQPARR